MASGVTFYRIAREVSTRIDILSRRVNEGKDIQSAKEFCSFLVWSGILNLLESESIDSNESNIPIDGPHLRWKCGELQRLVNDRIKENSKSITIEMCALEKINHNLELLAGQVAVMSHRLVNSDDVCFSHVSYYQEA